MKSWLPIERRFLATLLDGILPGAELAPDREPTFWMELERAAPPILHFGLRASAWLFGSWLGLLPAEARDRVLTRFAASHLYLVWQLILSVKLVACLAFYDREHHRASPRP